MATAAALLARFGAMSVLGLLALVVCVQPAAAQCSTPEQQAGTQCQALCACNCSSGVPLSQGCTQVCQLPNGVQSVPWCTPTAGPCTGDDDAAFIEYMNRTGQWTVDITACVDAPSCTPEIAVLCCAHCQGGDNVTLEVPWADDNDPVSVFISLGQSNCAGSASADLMKADGAHPELFERDTRKSRAWFAGLTSRDGDLSEDSFGVTALWAGVAGSRHGPEFTLGYRLQRLTGKRVLIFKYCNGGTSAKQDWNPDWRGFSGNAGNWWDRSADNKTAAFLKDLRVGNPKNQQYLRAIYNLRLMREELDTGGVKHEFAGVFWRQSSADKDSTWQQYGADQIRVFNALRAEVGVPDMPVIFEGDTSRANIHAGKVYAAKVLCHATVGAAQTSQQRPDTLDQCTPSIGNNCLDYLSFTGEFENQFGWDVNFPPEYKVPKPGFSGATSRFVVRFSGNATLGIAPNLHDEYDGMFIKGNSMANAYVREHTSYPVPLPVTEWDAWAKWPIKRCTASRPWSETNYCWVDDSAQCDLGLEAQATPVCASVTAESCRSTEDHYTNCPCACSAASTCVVEPPVIDPGTLTYFPAMPPPLTWPATTSTGPATTSTGPATTSTGSTPSTATTTGESSEVSAAAPALPGRGPVVAVLASAFLLLAA